MPLPERYRPTLTEVSPFPMCLITFALDQHPEYSLVLVANRDEFYERPTEAAHFWPESPDILAGRDLQQGGTWLGIRTDGRWAAVTNFRDLERRQYPLSRGDLTRRFLNSDTPAAEFIQDLHPTMTRYGGFNLLLGDASGVHYCSNRTPHEATLAPGVYGLSNHLLDTPWPKLVKAKVRLRRLLGDTPSPSDDELMVLLADPTIHASDDEDSLPHASVDPNLERALSAAFINTPHYGTLCTTVLTVSRRGKVRFVEQSFGADGQPGHRAVFEFPLRP